LVVTDMRMPQGDGLGVLQELRQISPGVPVIFLTAYASVPDAVAAMKYGACEYLAKPVAFEQLELAVARALGSSGACRLGPVEAAGPRLLGQSPCWQAALARARTVAVSDADVLIQAESGSGKELLSRMIHDLSPRKAGPFVAVNCAALPETLLESELFGHARGAFTGALNARAGKFELAHGGTLLLDEVGEMPLALQPKLLRALQEREFERLGDNRKVRVDIRVIATTHRSLKSMIAAGEFRADLYYRLHVIPLSLPPLRERPEDIVTLALHFARQYGTPTKEPLIDPEFLVALKAHTWPGNVRELENLMRRAVALCPERIGLQVFDPEEFGSHDRYSAVRSESAPELHTSSLAVATAGTSLALHERRLFENTLAATQGNRSRAAEMLGISLRTVRNKIRVYGLPSRRSYEAAVPGCEQNMDKTGSAV
jgi:DNA-binding NtrC family response regulator